MKELASKYNHIDVEKGQYDNWVKNGYFEAGDLSKEPFTIVIPPPNVTGKLHLGHAWDNTLQDILARYKRLKGYDVLYLPGMDHAGIATQAKVDALLKEQGLSRYDLGREGFLNKAWEWKKEYAGHIREQWASMGIGLDYTRERFTLDDGLNKAVNKVFVDLYNEGLIYQDYKIINWDPVAKTALSNIEVYHQDDAGKMYYFDYKVKEKNKSFTVATTRPETMFGDVCVVVHPDDLRYKDLIGLHAINPANNQELIIIADDYIDVEFGSGAMKCTPAHDPNDFMIAERHNLDKPICMNPDGTMNSLANEFEGLDRFVCREKLVEKIKNEGNLIKIEDITHPVGHSERTHAVIEPYLSKQWFVKMKPLASDVLNNQKNEKTKINFYPSRFEKTFNQWLENIEDWCISRQLWWGHRIPAYYHKETNEIIVSEIPPKDIENYIQDEDVLDTWFSSALWPFSTLGWPENTDDLNRYYPTSCMVTGYDIIFFWVARMAIQGRHFTNNYPFKDVLIHGLTRDSQGRKMSKSLGNGINPLEVKEKYGVDALRFFLTTNSAPGQDIRYIEEKVESSWNFINKLWNASRFVMMNLPENYNSDNFDTNKLSDIDKWIINKFNKTLTIVGENMEKYEFAIVGSELYSFVWDDFCSWYIELCKSELNSDDKEGAMYTLYTILNSILKMLHPFMPFVSEKIYQALHNETTSIHKATWPNCINIGDFNFNLVEKLISLIKNIREVKVENNLKPSTPLDIKVTDLNDNVTEFSDVLKEILFKMTKSNINNSLVGELSVRAIFDGKLYISSSQLIDKEAEILKLTNEEIRLNNEINRCKNMLSNEKFTSKAPIEKVNEEKIKLEKYLNEYEIVINRLKELK
ncbi:MAG: valine--tRNA ligase [Erysipelotrichaceae bacterium]|nr:valine--tRNA ligase [Erysipelotrichaceae bacterium]